MPWRKRIIFQVGGPDLHPSTGQADVIIDWLGPTVVCHKADGLAAFEHLDECDLLVLMGLHWTGLEKDYRPPAEHHRRAFERYVASGKPLLAYHSAIASYDDWPQFGRLVGFTWVRGQTSYSPVMEHHVQVLPTGHPIIAGLSSTFAVFGRRFS